jgi:hypothetical protein
LERLDPLELFSNVENVRQREGGQINEITFLRLDVNCLRALGRRRLGRRGRSLKGRILLSDGSKILFLFIWHGRRRKLRRGQARSVDVHAGLKVIFVAPHQITEKGGSVKKSEKYWTTGVTWALTLTVSILYQSF